MLNFLLNNTHFLILIGFLINFLSHVYFSTAPNFYDGYLLLMKSFGLPKHFVDYPLSCFFIFSWLWIRNTKIKEEALQRLKISLLILFCWMMIINFFQLVFYLQ